jgi:diguanylate cyclase (GGDEF)-like protein
MKLLVADDDPVSRLLMQRTLQKEGYDVMLADNGRTSAEILSRSDGPRLALVDWMMPELDGLSLCREIRSNPRDGFYVYIVLLTSRQDSADIVAGLNAGADDYITKPCHPAELRARLHTGRRILSLEDKLIHAREEMRFKATHDALTTLWNRAAILSLVRNELSRSFREGRPTSLLLCDIDHFKQVNDIHGHLAGDMVLEEVAKRLTASVRSYDAVGRYGGEEFLILLSECDEHGLAVRAEDVRRAIACTPIAIDSTRLSMTISIGALTCNGKDAFLPLEHILAQADTALYQAKAAGRNRTIIATVETAALST